jgi:predicted HAD superfamily Cof-like phosphohydrolase
MYETQRKIRAWMRAVEQVLPEKPTPATHEVRVLRAKLVLEEAQELVDALGFSVKIELDVRDPKEPDFVEMIDALCDLMYVVEGAGCAFGVDLEAFFAEVHDSNCTKIGGLRREDGKVVKPPWYRVPNLQPILDAQMGEGFVLPTDEAELTRELQLVQQVSRLQFEKKLLYQENESVWEQLAEAKRQLAELKGTKEN